MPRIKPSPFRKRRTLAGTPIKRIMPKYKPITAEVRFALANRLKHKSKRRNARRTIYKAWKRYKAYKAARAAAVKSARMSLNRRLGTDITRRIFSYL